MSKEKIQEIFANIVQLILKYNKVNSDFIFDLNERIGSATEEIFKHLMDLNNRFSDYKLRDDLD